MSILQGNTETAKIGVDQPPNDPLVLLRAWMEQALQLNIPDYQVLVIGSVRADGRPRARAVSAKACDHAGVIFGTSKRSRKGNDFAHCPYASGVFWWPSIVQQVTMMGTVEILPAGQSDQLFADRTRDAQAVATVSQQSEELLDEEELRRDMRNLVDLPGTLPRPEHWCAFRLVIDRIEFWHGRVDRLHRRLEYTRDEADRSIWRMRRLQP